MDGLSVATTEKKASEENEDKLSETIGKFGRWQLFIFLLVAVPVKFSAGTATSGIIYLGSKTTFRCTETDLLSDTKNSTCYDKCTKYAYYSQFENTIISEWELICDRAWLADLTQTVFMCGVLVGSIVFGFIADRFGRRIGIIMSCMLQLIASFATSFCNDYWIFNITRFFLGTATAGNMLSSFVMIMEITGPSYVELVTSIYHVPLAIGEALMPAFGYYLRSWDTLSIGVAIPNLIYLTYLFLLPESPKWLISMGRLDEASKVMTKAAKINKLSTDNIVRRVKVIATEANVDVNVQRTRATYMDLITKDSLRTRNLCSCICWFSLGINYYGTSQYFGQTTSNVSMAMALTGVLKIPAIMLSGILFKRFGRRAATIGFLLVSALCTALLALPESWFYLKLAAGAVGTSCTTGAFTTMYTYTSELFPTAARNMAMGASSTVSRVGSALAPFIAGLKTEALWLPPAVFSVVPVAAIGACYFLPETKGKKTADSLDK